MAKPITMFSWGYYGWGTHGKDLLRLSAAVEQGRGFKPPVFVDIRAQRSGWARDFKGPTFERMARSRYKWMRDLGNQRVIDRSNGIEIRRPAAVEDLLDLAIQCAKSRQRIIFFCSCGWPAGCHRAHVADLLLRAARRRGVALDVTEWPGGEPRATPTAVAVDGKVLKRVAEGGADAYLPGSAPVSTLAALAVGSLVKVTSGDRSFTFPSFPVQPHGNRWYLEPLCSDTGLVPPKANAIARWRKAEGYARRRA